MISAYNYLTQKATSVVDSQQLLRANKSAAFKSKYIELKEASLLLLRYLAL